MEGNGAHKLNSGVSRFFKWNCWSDIPICYVDTPFCYIDTPPGGLTKSRKNICPMNS